MAIRCKFQVASKVSYPHTEAVQIRLQACYDQTIPEDQRFCAATPAGQLEIMVNNPRAIAQLELGQSFYLDLTPVEEPGAAGAG